LVPIVRLLSAEPVQPVPPSVPLVNVSGAVIATAEL
jgi:hypothetical protein